MTQNNPRRSTPPGCKLASFSDNFESFQFELLCYNGRMAVLIDSLKDTIKDTVTLIPFLFITYLAMEWLEDKTEDQSVAVLSRISRFSHVLGAGIGLIPQCGFSAGAASLYSGGVITAGTLIAVFLSTSDEMIPIFISSSVAPATIGRILAAKFIIALISGIVVDAASRVIRYGFHADKHIHDLCEREQCGCEDEEGGIVHSAFVHTLKITGFIFVISLALSLILGFAGEETVASIMTSVPLLATILTGIIGLIPNCAASVVITQMYLEGLLTCGQLMAGLLVGAGVGLLVLFRTNNHHRENIAITGVLLMLGICWGVFIDIMGISF